MTLEEKQTAMRERMSQPEPSVDYAPKPKETLETLTKVAAQKPMTLTETENQAKRELEEEGWTVVRSGWPDFLCFRTDDAGNMVIHPVEVKQKAHRHFATKGNQRLVAKLLKAAGLPVVIYNPGDKSILYSLLSTRERIRLALQKRKDSGKRLGRPPLNYDAKKIIADRKAGMSLSQLAKAHNVSITTIGRVLDMAEAIKPE